MVNDHTDRYIDRIYSRYSQHRWKLWEEEIRQIMWKSLFESLKRYKRYHPLIRFEEYAEKEIVAEVEHWIRENGYYRYFYLSLDSALYNALLVVRLMIVKKRGVPAYVIFSEAALREMCEKLPVTRKAFLQISGATQTKLDRYVEKFMRVIKGHIAKNAAKEYEKEKAYSVDEIRASGLTSAYEKWTDEEVRQLIREYNNGMEIKAIAEIHGRTAGAIRSRLKKEQIIQ